MPSEDIKLSLKKYCTHLQSGDRKIRKQAYIELEILFKDQELTNDELRNIFTDIQMYTLNGLRDQTEANREQAINFLRFFVLEKLPLNDFYLTYILPVIVERIGTVELIEESEEIRLELVKFLQQIIEKYSNTEQLRPFIGDFILILKETVKDKFPTIKELSCKVINQLASALPKDFHLQAENLVKPTLTCFNHQRFKVRVAAIEAIGDIVMHSSYNALNDVVTPMAERLFDQIPIVRMTVARVAAKWLLDYRDRYSFFHKILPLILTGLSDEVKETREESAKLWEKVGLQYLQENEKDFKDQMDFCLELPDNYPKHLIRPNLGCRALVKRNVSKLAPALSIELTSWQYDIRVRCSQLLCTIVWHAEEGLTQNLQGLLPAMYSSARDDDKRVTENIEEAAKIMGTFVPCDTWTKVVLPMIIDGIHWGYLSVLGSLIEGTSKTDIVKKLPEICQILANDSICYNRKRDFQRKLLRCVKIILTKLDETFNKAIGYHIMKIIIVLNALKDIENQEIIDFCMVQDLENILKIPNAWIEYLPILLKHIDFDPKSWTIVTYQRCIFEMILLHSKEAFGQNLNHIGEILVKTLNVESNPEARLKTFWALSDALNSKSIIFKNAINLGDFYIQLIMDIIHPNLIWRAGRTSEALRTMTVSCLKYSLTPPDDNLINIDFFKNTNFKNIFDKLRPVLLSTMEDASYHSRMLSIDCIVLLKIIAIDKNVWECDDLIKIYPEIFKRFDDPIEIVRLTALKATTIIFQNCPNEFKTKTFKSHHEFIYDTLLLHFDDNEVEELLYEILKDMCTINNEMLRDKIDKGFNLLRNQKGLNNLLDYINNLKI